MKISNKYNLFFSFLVLGISSIVTQVIVLRELIITFYGNEFFIAVALASWLFWVAVGSALAGKILSRFNSKIPFLIGLHFLAAILFFLEISLIRLSRSWVTLAGQAPNLIYALIGALVLTAPICLILGLWWTTSTRILGKFYKNKALACNRAYLTENLGFILGGTIFSFFLVQLQEFLVGDILFCLNLLSVFVLVLYQREYGYHLLKIATILLLSVSSLISFSPYLEKLNRITTNYRFKNQHLIQSTNSPYGNIAVTQTDHQFNFYESGLLLGSNHEIQFSEKLIHLALLQHPAPKQVLLIGGGFNGALNEISKHPVEKVYYLELDPRLIEVAKNYLPIKFKKALRNPMVKVINMDGRYFLKQTRKKFDVVIVNLADPSNCLLSRFYTQEFFQDVKRKLNKRGVVATHLTFSVSAPGKNLEDLNACIFHTLENTFKNVMVLPEYTNFFLASDQKNLSYNPKIILQRFKKRNIKTHFLTPSYIAWRLSTDRIQENLNRFSKNKTASINKDLKPVAYFYYTLFWLDRFYPTFSRAFEEVASNFWLIIGVTLIVLSLMLIKKYKRKQNPAALFSAGVAGFSLMSLETLIIFIYQIMVGYLYYRIALLISVLMMGMALGTWYGINRIKKLQERNSWSLIFKFHLLLILFCGALPFIYWLLSKTPSSMASEIIILSLALGAGFLGSVIFPLANDIYLRLQKQPNKKTGAIYSADLAGSCLGALLPGLILIPVFGVLQNLILIALINLWIMALLIYRRTSQRTSASLI